MNPPVPSAGCNKPTTITSSIYPAYRKITSSGEQRDYVIDMPTNYDPNKPYRFIMGSHGQGGEGNDIQREDYYGIRNIAGAASSTIFVSASGLGGIWGLKDVPLFDDILNFVKANACVDESRVFVLGFSFGGMYSYSLSMTRQDTIRAGIGMSPANYAIQIPPKTHGPIAWMQSTGMSDTTCREVHRDRARHGQWLHRTQPHSDMDLRQHALQRLRRVRSRISGQGVHVQRWPQSPTRRCQLDVDIHHPILGIEGLPNGRYVLSVWAKSSGAGARLSVRHYQPSTDFRCEARAAPIAAWPALSG
jgi:hypothetical protein